MTSFLARTFAVLALQPATICAVLGTSREMMNCSAVPITLSTDKIYDLLCRRQPKIEQKLLQLFSTFSDTMQFTEKLAIQARLIHTDVIRGILEHLINKRYFTRTIRVLELQSADALIEACCSPHNSPTTTTPILLSNLRSLSISGYVSLQNEELKAICSLCPFLENLNIISHQPQVTDEGLECVSNLRHLKTLKAHHCGKITDNGLAHLSKLSSLRTLDLRYCQLISDSGMQHLAKLSSLQSLNLYCVKITDIGLQHLAKLSYLQSLLLSECYGITDSGLQHLTQLSTLQLLNLGGCEKITDTGLQYLAKLPSLQSLNLESCDNITDIGLQHLAALFNLQTLDLSFCEKITDTGLRHLAKISSIKSLYLEGCDHVTDEGCCVLDKTIEVIR